MSLAAKKQGVRERDILASVVGILKKNLNPAKIILFGSRARGSNTGKADFDFAVDTAQPSIDVRRKISDEMEHTLGLYSADIIYLQSVDSDFANLVLTTGKVIYERGD